MWWATQWSDGSLWGKLAIETKESLGQSNINPFILLKIDALPLRLSYGFRLRDRRRKPPGKGKPEAIGASRELQQISLVLRG
ncbi:hypothetical protein [Phormidium sp. CCY1219]|uniref:hypothetical protein n=1 Tax=Phormidium sp. CCY1219 TaxID=2886104 RepID=UPI002D1F41A8|nr:hypothetical protein [Phormidium sp. CCY1219]MEB3831638.1 hypothetical protein [Phormidium sp. CCY1219]